MSGLAIVVALLPVLTPLIKELLPEIWSLIHAPETAVFSSEPDADDVAVRERLRERVWEEA
jgi:hypothetical protein